jgi:hypothetical protein
MFERASMKNHGPTTAFEIVKRAGLALPEVEAMTNWAGLPEPGTLVVRCALDARERFLEDAPDTYYVTEYYRPYPVVLVRLSHLDLGALRDLLSVSWRMAVEKARTPTRRGARSGAGRA